MKEGGISILFFFIFIQLVFERLKLTNIDVYY